MRIDLVGGRPLVQARRHLSEVIVRFIETYRGSSFPTLAELASGRMRVVKLRGAGNGAEALLSEFVVNRLAHDAGLPVPDASLAFLPADFPWSYGTDEYHDIVRKSAGFNLALDVIPRAIPLPIERYADVPKCFVSQVVTLDRVFSNWDRTDLSGNVLVDHRGQLWIVDHGSCRFLQEPADRVLPALPVNHKFYDDRDAFDASWLDLLTSDSVRHVVDTIPEDWLLETNHTHVTVAEAIDARLTLARARLD